MNWYSSEVVDYNSFGLVELPDSRQLYCVLDGGLMGGKGKILTANGWLEVKTEGRGGCRETAEMCITTLDKKDKEIVWGWRQPLAARTAGELTWEKLGGPFGVYEITGISYKGTKLEIPGMKEKVAA